MMPEPTLGEDDLRTLFATRAEHPPQPAERLAAVQRRATAIRRRRVAAVAGALALLVGAAVAGPTVAHRLDSAPAGPYNRQIDGLPEYLNGYRLIGHAVLRPGAYTASFTISPTTYDLFYAWVCPEAENRNTLTLKTKKYSYTGSPGCDNLESVSFTRNTAYPRKSLEEVARNLGVVPGRPLAITATADQVLPGVTVRVGIWEAVPPGQYPLPPRPKLIHPPFALADASWSVVPTASTPNITVIRTVTLTPTLVAQLSCTVPGMVRLAIDGMTVMEYDCWNYFGGTNSARLVTAFEDAGGTATVGRQVTLTVTAERFTDPAWRVDLGEQH
jgi:hypothetical protein